MSGLVQLEIDPSDSEKFSNVLTFVDSLFDPTVRTSITITSASDDGQTRAGFADDNSIALIDNYANGLEGTEIDFAKFKDLVKENQAKVNRLFVRLLEILR